MQLAAVLFALAALGGGTILAIRLRGLPRPPTWLALGHGAIAATGLATLIYAATQGIPALGLVALVLFILTAAGGATIFLLFHLREKPLPISLIFAHGALAVAAFVVLLVAILSTAY